MGSRVSASSPLTNWLAPIRLDVTAGRIGTAEMQKIVSQRTHASSGQFSLHLVPFLNSSVYVLRLFPVTCHAIVEPDLQSVYNVWSSVEESIAVFKLRSVSSENPAAFAVWHVRVDDELAS